MSVALSSAWAIEALGASALLMAAVLALRGPVRRQFGARIAYALWALPLLRLALPPLPAGWRTGVATPVIGIGEQAARLVAPVVAAPLAPAPALVAVIAVPTVDWIAVALGVWLVGAALFLLWHVVDYARFRHRVLHQAVPIARSGRVAVIVSGGTDGPLAFGVLRRMVVLPADFEARYDSAERDMAMAHELAHHARGDLLANWCALALLALHWCNPLAWLAFRAFRADQELATDAAVLARANAAARHAYGCAIVKAAHGRAVAAACHLHTIHDLKGRLRMLRRGDVTGFRLIAGMAVTATVTLGALLATASGSAAADQARDHVEQATGVTLDRIDPLAALATLTQPRAAAVKTVTRTHHLVVTQDGRTTTYDGAAADAYAVHHQLPAPPPPAPAVVDVPAVPDTPRDASPPAPLAPPSPPAASARHGSYVGADGKRVTWISDARPVYVPAVESRDCGGGDARSVVLHRIDQGRQVMTICTDRIARLAQHAEQTALQTGNVRRQAYASALESLRASRASMAAQSNMPKDALADMDDAIRELQQEAASDD